MGYSYTIDMRKIYKYTLEIKQEQTICFDGSPEILTAQMQDGHIVLWATVYLGERTAPEKRRILIFGTGQEIPNRVITYISTVQSEGLVWHIFYN